MTDFHFIKDEMLVHIPACTHASPSRALVIGGCDNIRNEFAKYSDFEELVYIDADGVMDSFANMGVKSFDMAVVADDSFHGDRDFWIELTKVLDEKAVVSATLPNIVSDESEAKRSLELLGRIYCIVMPYRYESYDSDCGLGSEYLVLASRFYHPTADINLQRADLTDGFRYYNSDIAIAAFQTPTFINRNYLGVIKR